ncbi:hypothetical protein [Streptoalloteichus hindustanus]|uniref:Uncharacterized protein n=1 Tax=Streptoalloteichus hindustanus TaxID=2017 RepID=A0A1M5N8L1_STRHI|nr:hypothetical protein [Streptoalloteichus hindustanus]SHG85880.1 hypothetical protein SAMN05444320_11533 [Streptoalloteichus hindustanus]
MNSYEKELKYDGLIALLERWSGPREPILMFTGHNLGSPRATHFDVNGLDRFGQRTSVATRSLRALSDGLEYTNNLGGVEHSGIPRLTVFGGHPDCSAMTLVAGRETLGFGYWIITPSRLAWVTLPQPAEESSSQGPEQSLLGLARGIGSGLRGLLGDKEAEKDTENKDVEKPPPPPPMVTVLQVPRQEIAVSVAERRMPAAYNREKIGCLRLTLPDGSGLDFSTDGIESAQWVFASVTGQR